MESELAMRDTIDVDLLRDRLEYVTAHPEEHDQGWWGVKRGCGTAYCIAGHVVIARGYELEWGEMSDIGPDGEYYAEIVRGTYHSISYIAQRELGLNAAQAVALFAGINSLWKLWHLAEEFTNGAITMPAGIEPTDRDRAETHGLDVAF